MTETTPNSKAPIGAGAGVGIVALVGLLGLFVTPHEGVELKSYADPVWGVAVPTACVGETGKHIRMGQTFTLEQCLGMLGERHKRLIVEIDKCVRVPIAVHEAVAILSMADNIGAPKICASTLVRQVNAGAPPAVWCEQIPLWRNAGGRDCRRRENNCYGLITRRDAERAMCLGQLTLPTSGA